VGGDQGIEWGLGKDIEMSVEQVIFTVRGVIWYGYALWLGLPPLVLPDWQDELFAFLIPSLGLFHCGICRKGQRPCGWASK
jgi:hypothetical protein